MRATFAAMAVMIVQLLAGCGGSSRPPHTATAHPSSGSGSTAENPFNGVWFKDAEARYVACMHAHGVTTVPGPGVSAARIKALTARSAAFRAGIIVCYDELVFGQRSGVERRAHETVT
jgi:hypothetical protein